MDAIGAKDATYEDFKAEFSFTDCRYAVFDQDFLTADGRPTSKVGNIGFSGMQVMGAGIVKPLSFGHTEGRKRFLCKPYQHPPSTLRRSPLI